MFFGKEASTSWRRQILEDCLGQTYRHIDIDIRNEAAIKSLFQQYGSEFKAIIHTAAQPSHDWAVTNPTTDFTINANGTLCLLESTRKYCPEAVFIHCSTNKVYGDRPNQLPLIEHEKRWDVDPTHPYANGIREDMPIDQCLHSLFGVSKTAADLMVQEYGKYFGLYTACFRAGCLTGPAHSGVQLHGFLAYLMKCTMKGDLYTIFGYKGKQVRDNIHSTDLIRAFYEFYLSPRIGEVYNIGGGTYSNCSIQEAIDLCQQVTNQELNWTYSSQSRRGDHIWYISDLSKFQSHYPNWRMTYDVRNILIDIYETNHSRWLAS